MKKRSMENFRAATAAVPRPTTPASPTVANPDPVAPSLEDDVSLPDGITAHARPLARHTRPLSSVRPKPVPPSSRPFPRQALAWFTGSVAIVVLAVIAIVDFSSVTQVTTNWAELLGAFLILGLASYAMVHYLRPTLTLIGYTSLAAVIVFGTFAYGLDNSVVLNGKVYWQGSTVAKAYTLSKSLQSSIDEMQADDVLLTYSVAEGRAHFAEYSVAITKVSELFTYWSTYTHSGLPDSAFIDVINNVSAAANADASVTSTGDVGALSDKLTYINNSYNDTTLASTITNERASVISALESAQVELNAINAKFHFSFTPDVHE
jgi:hypothetical protein